MSPNKWGPPTWRLFHSLAEKIKDEHYDQLGNSLFNFIKQICFNLPCPDCTQHATMYFSKSSIHKITSKQLLKDFLFSFHNHVNKRKGKKQFINENLSIHNSSNLINTFNNFVAVYNTNGNMKLLADNFHRQRLLGNR